MQVKSAKALYYMIMDGSIHAGSTIHDHNGDEYLVVDMESVAVIQERIVPEASPTLYHTRTGWLLSTSSPHFPVGVTVKEEDE